MSPFGFTALSGAWLFLLLIPLVVFYFLKLRRPRIEIPSLILWQQVLNDSRVNSPFQRFKRNLLLFLQLLLLLLLILAAMQPFWRSGASRAARLPILIDVSASMASLDKKGGITRLEEAKKRARRTIDSMHKGQKVCIISFDDSARKMTGFTDNKRILIDALDQLAVTDVPSNPEDALRMAQAISSREPFEEVLLLSDGNFPERTDFELSFTLDYERLPAGGPNLAITSMNARRSGDLSWDVFVNIDGAPQLETAGSIVIYQGDEVIDSQAIALDAGESDRLIFSVDGDVGISIKAVIKPAGFDALASDNEAYIELPALRPLFVYAPRSLTTYHKGLVGIPGIQVYNSTSAQENFDLVISDSPADIAMPSRAAFFVGIMPEELKGIITAGEGSSDVVDWVRNDSLLQHVNFSDLVIQSTTTFVEGKGQADLEERGFTTLVHGTEGPLMVGRPTETRQEYYLLFHSDNSTMPFRIGFPIMLANLKRITNDNLGMNEIRAYKTGVLPRLQLDAETTYTIRGPKGLQREIATNTEGILSGVPAPLVGEYRVEHEGQLERTLSVALLHAAESSLIGVEQMVFNELAVDASTETHKSDRNLWPVLTFLAFILLLAEWAFFQRRPGGWRPRQGVGA
jgi:hypothetical protein